MGAVRRFFNGSQPREALSWAFYDWANSAYYTLIVTFAYAIYFNRVVVGGAAGDFWWGAVLSVSAVVGGLLAPIVGAVADYDARRKRKFILFTLAAIAGTALLYFSKPGMLVYAAIVFMLTNIVYEIAIILYDSFLVHIATDKTAGRISGLGWGMGYAGGLVAMGLLYPLYGGGYENGMDGLYRLVFPLTALYYLVFAIPAFLWIREPPAPKKRGLGLGEMARIGLRRTWEGILELRERRDLLRFFIAFYLLNNGLVAAFSFVPIFASATLGMSVSQISVFLVVIQLVGFPSTAFFGWLSDRKGRKTILLWAIAAWAGIILSLVLTSSHQVFYALAVACGLVIGSSQAVARSWLSRLVPKEKRSEFFGFNGFATKVSAPTGLLVFGIVSSLFASQRLAMLTLLPFFAGAFLLFRTVPEK